MNTPLSRRHVLRAGAGLSAAALAPSSLSAQGKTLVAATFPGTWNEAHREFLAPAFTRRTGAAVTQSILLGTDQISRLAAAKEDRRLTLRSSIRRRCSMRSSRV
jgi:putative spermidine/putrescine transport system substrate-binding protein